MVLNIGNSSVISVVIKGVDELSGLLKKSEKDLTKFSQSAKRVGAVMFATGTAATLALTKLSISAGKNIAIGKAFNNMFGKGSVRALKDLRSATKGTVSEIDLMKQANQALLLGIDQDALPKMFRGAMAAAQATGRPVSDAIQDITTGIGRQSKLILDNLGIIVDVKKANEDYAKTLGKQAKELTEVEKKAAFTAATMKALDENMKKVGDTGDNASLAFQRLKAALKDAAGGLGAALSTDVGNLTDRITELVLQFNNLDDATKKYISKGALITSVTTAIAGAFLFLGAQLATILPLITTLTAALGVGFLPLLAIFAGSIVGIVTTFKQLNEMTAKWRRLLALSNPMVFAFSAALVELKDLFLQNTQGARESAKVISNLGDKYDETTGKLIPFSNETNDLVGRMLLASEATRNMGESAQSIQPQIDGTARSIRTLTLASEALARVGIFVGGFMNQGDLAGTASTLATAAARANITSAAGLAQAQARDVGIGFLRSSIDRPSGPTTGTIFREAARNMGRNVPFGQAARAFTPGRETGIRRANPEAFAFGGVINGPTLALMGEAGPERVTPLGRGGDGGDGSQVIVNIDTISGIGLTMDELVSEFEKRLRTMISS